MVTGSILLANFTGRLGQFTFTYIRFPREFRVSYRIDTLYMLPPRAGLSLGLDASIDAIALKINGKARDYMNYYHFSRFL